MYDAPRKLECLPVPTRVRGTESVTKDMLSRVREQRPSYNNSSWISSSITVSGFKLFYYRAFAVLYGMVGSLASVVMVNSTWTQRHMSAMWRLSSPVVVYPPCDTAEFDVSISLVFRRGEE